MSYPGYSSAEYAGAVHAALMDRFGLSAADAEGALRRSREYETTMRYFSGYAGRSPSPSALANKIGRELRLKKHTKVGPPMESGYAYEYQGRGDWVDVIVGEDKIRRAVFQGFGTIYGNRMAIWRVGRKTYAQTAVGPRHESHWVQRGGGGTSPTDPHRRDPSRWRR